MNSNPPVLFTVLSDACEQGDPYAPAVSKRLAGWLDQMDMNLVGHDEDGNPIKHAATECTAEQQMRAARFVEYDLRDAIVIAKNNQTKQSNETKTKRIERLTGELDCLMAALPPRMDAADLEALLIGMVSEACLEYIHESSKKITAVVMNQLRTEHFGQYDGRAARDLVQHFVSSMVDGGPTARP